MGLIFTNLAGLWALLGIPILLLIHFLQKERREVVATTLFLLGDMQRESKSGIRLERLRNSLPLWLQILAVLLLTWMLTEPRRIRPDSFQRIVIVLDSSAAMSAFLEETIPAIGEEAGRLARTTARQEWIVLETDPDRGTLYSGESRTDMREALLDWRPRSGTHDVIAALERARALLRHEGSVLFVTSRDYPNLPSGIQTLATGSPIPNSGFTGVRIESDENGFTWHALLRNHGSSARTLAWRAIFGDRTTARETVRLEPGQTVALNGRFPSGIEEGLLKIDGDRFSLDDELPIAVPRPKPLTILAEDHPALEGFMEPFLQSLPAWSPSGPEREDFRIATRLRTQLDPANPGVYFLTGDEPSDGFLTAPILAENHPLMHGLNWQGLLVRTTDSVPIGDEDRVLLWQGELPLIVLRQKGRDRWLFFNFDLRRSNAARLPAFVILLHRFVDRIRDGKPAFAQRNLQTGQTISVTANPLGGDLRIRFRNARGIVTENRVELHRAGAIPTPGETGFLDIAQSEQPLLRAAVHFADARQADFTDAVSRKPDSETAAAILQRNVADPFLTPLWLLLLAATLVFSWWLTGRGAAE